MEIVTVNKIPVEVEWKDIKNIHLTVYPPDARVHISAPLSMPHDSVRMYIVTKLEWIHKRIDMIQKQSRQTDREFVSGENHYFKGIRYRLNVVYQQAPPSVSLNGTQYINLFVREGATTEKRAEIMREWYRMELKSTLQPVIEKWEQILQVKPRHWEVKQMKTMWGSCNHKTQRLIFNLELIKKPSHCIEYIVAHEMTHLIERLHNSRFAAILDAHIPNWRLLKDELNEFIV